MKRQIRRGVFETNSSSCHSIIMCSEEQFNKWKDGELLFDEWEEEFVEPLDLTGKDKKAAKQNYENSKDEYSKDWDELSDSAQEKYYKKYGEENGLLRGNGITYEKYMDDDYLEAFVDSYTTKSGEKVIAFGKYGYDG